MRGAPKELALAAFRPLRYKQSLYCENLLSFEDISFLSVMYLYLKPESLRIPNRMGYATTTSFRYSLEFGECLAT